MQICMKYISYTAIQPKDLSNFYSWRLINITLPDLQYCIRRCFSPRHGDCQVSEGPQSLPPLRPEAAQPVGAGLPRPLVQGGRGGAHLQVSHTSKVREKYFQFNLSRVVTMLVMALGTSGRGGVTRVSLETELTSSSAPLLPSSGWRTSRTRRREFTGVVWTSR